MSTFAITGATGTVGSALTKKLRERGDEVIPISRSEQTGGIQWDLENGRMDAAALESADVVIHLAGAGIADGRWTDERKRVILESRTQSARLLIDSIAKLGTKPKAFISASGVGYYGPKHTGEVDESAPLGKGFLASVCKEWEAEAMRAELLGMRVAIARLGVVLSPEGGALEKMLPPFRLGLGGPVGSGKQRLGWISLDDVVNALIFLADNGEAAGAFNITSPEIVTNKEFADALGRVLNRPTKLPAPAFALKLAFGEMAEETVLADSPAKPARLLESRFTFEYPQLDAALKHILS